MKNCYRCPKFIGLILGLLLLTGCAVAPKTLVQLQPHDAPRKIAIFFDGTANDVESNTNIKKLHSLITLQKRSEIVAIYIEGVGTDLNLIGMGTGWGIGMRIRKAYRFLLENYRSGDEIYIFGFSRGAYSARILASLLHYAGIPNGAHQPQEMADFIFDAFKGNKDGKTRREDINRVLSSKKIPPSLPVQVAVLALWDTVEALGLPDFKENVDIPNGRYGDQLCNVVRAYHAVSIDDDRARIFTPILLTRSHLLDDCDKEIEDVANYINKTVDEVWFSGAHGDVGGVYSDSLLSGVSLNWMIGKLKGTRLLPNDASAPENLFGKSHDPEKGLVGGLLYKKLSRNLRHYAECGVYNKNKLKLHRSVIQRLAGLKLEENTQRLAGLKPEKNEFPWLNKTAYPHCFEETGSGYHYLDAKKCFDIED